MSRESVIDKILVDFNAKHEGHGIEAIWNRSTVKVDCVNYCYYGDIVLLYVNMGDTYVGTIAYSPITDKIYYGDMEEIIKQLPKKLQKAISLS
jgi:hypothetical protein